MQESEQPDNMIMAYLLRNKIQLTELKIKKKNYNFTLLLDRQNLTERILQNLTVKSLRRN